MRAQHSEVRIAMFITSHGFGHAARAIAVAEALSQRCSTLEFDLYTAVPRWFFDSARIRFTYRYLDCDPGLSQVNAFDVDLAASVQRLAVLLPFKRDLIKQVAALLLIRRCQAVVCDIAVFGIAVAKDAGLPSILIENFTWDWIYRALSKRLSVFATYADIVAPLVACADLHIQAQPACAPLPGSLSVAPISRQVRTSGTLVRAQLGIKPGSTLIFITLGGVEQKHPFLYRLAHQPVGQYFLIAGSGSDNKRSGNIRLLPSHSDFFHPDLVNSSDLVVGKVGYSTLAEVYRTGARFAYFRRQDNPEMPALLNFLKQNVSGVELDSETYRNGNWLDQIPNLLSQPASRPPTDQNGALACADSIITLLQHRDQ